MIAAIAELPFRQRPVLELLNLVDDRTEPDPDYAGYGWARTSRLWLVDAHGEVESWVARDDGRIELRAPSWHNPVSA